MSARLNIVLSVLLLLSCFWLVRSSNEARRLLVDLERAQAREQELETDAERLKIERRTAATPLVVEDMVRQKLRMFNVSPAVTHYVSEALVGVPLPSLPASAADASSMPAATVKGATSNADERSGGDQ